MPDPATTISRPAPETQDVVADDADIEAILNEAEALVRTTLDGASDEPPVDDPQDPSAADASTGDDAVGSAPVIPAPHDANDLVASVAAESPPSVADLTDSSASIAAEAAPQAREEPPPTSPQANGTGVIPLERTPTPQDERAAAEPPQPPAPLVTHDPPVGPRPADAAAAAQSERRIGTRILLAPLVLVACVLALIDRPFSFLSAESRRAVGWVAIGTTVMGGLAWLLPWLFGRPSGTP